MNEVHKDSVIPSIAEYTANYEVSRQEALVAARLCLMDALGCAIEALRFPDCIRLLGPLVPDLQFPEGVRVPGTQFRLDPLSAAFNTTTMIRWLDLNDAFSALEGGHSSDNIGAILTVADYVNRKRGSALPRMTMKDVLVAVVKAYEIQGVLSLENSFSLLGFDYIPMAKVAATAVATRMLGGGTREIANAVSNAWADGAPLKVYRQNENTGSRKSWAGGDAASRAIWLAMLAMKGEMGYPGVLTARTYGLYDAMFKGQPFTMPCTFGTYAVEHAMFKFVPAGMEAQTAAECALRLHASVASRLDEIESIRIDAHEKMIRMMDKKGPLTNPADRDHCSQYVIAVMLLHGRVGSDDFSDEFAADPRIDGLRAMMVVEEDPSYTKSRLDPGKRANSCAIQIGFKDGSKTQRVEVEYPLGHMQRRSAAIPALEAKFDRHIARRFPSAQHARILKLFESQEALENTWADDFLEAFVI